MEKCSLNAPNKIMCVNTLKIGGNNLKTGKHLFSSSNSFFFNGKKSTLGLYEKSIITSIFYLTFLSL